MSEEGFGLCVTCLSPLTQICTKQPEAKRRKQSPLSELAEDHD